MSKNNSLLSQILGFKDEIQSSLQKKITVKNSSFFQTKTSYNEIVHTYSYNKAAIELILYSVSDEYSFLIGTWLSIGIPYSSFKNMSWSFCSFIHLTLYDI